MKVYTELGTAQLQIVFLIFAINFPLFRVAKGSEILQGTLGKNKINWLKMQGCQENWLIFFKFDLPLIYTGEQGTQYFFHRRGCLRN